MFLLKPNGTSNCPKLKKVAIRNARILDKVKLVGNKTKKFEFLSKAEQQMGLA